MKKPKKELQIIERRSDGCIGGSGNQMNLKDELER